MKKSIVLGILGLLIGYIFLMFVSIIFPSVPLENSTRGCAALVTGLVFGAIGLWYYSPKRANNVSEGNHLLPLTRWAGIALGVMVILLVIYNIAGYAVAKTNQNALIGEWESPSMIWRISDDGRIMVNENNPLHYQVSSWNILRLQNVDAQDKPIDEGTAWKIKEINDKEMILLDAKGYEFHFERIK